MKACGEPASRRPQALPDRIEHTEQAQRAKELARLLRLPPERALSMVRAEDQAKRARPPPPSDPALGPSVQWVHSYVTDDKIYCVYNAASEALVREHARPGGFPANSLAQVRTVSSSIAAEA